VTDLQASSRARRQAETRQLLLDTAERMFCDEGYAATSLDRVAASAGFTTGAIYANFAGKEGLFLALQERRMQRLTAAGRAEVPAGASREVRLHAFGRYVGELAREQRSWALVAAEFWAQAARRPELARELAGIHQRDRREVAELIRGLVPDALAADEAGLDELARQVVALIDGLATQGYVDDSFDFVEVFAHGFVKLITVVPASGQGGARRAARSRAGR
jgi:AcrR family transcriptional regulator